MQITVKSGDTLWSLAQRYLGDGNRWQELGFSGDPRKLQVGTTLNFQTDQEKQQAATTTQPSTPAQPAQNPTTSVEQLNQLATQRAKDFVDQILNQIQNQQPYPEFQWTEEDQRNALTYAESVYGGYFANLLKDYTDQADLARTRLDQDTQTNIQNAMTQLSDYINQSETTRTRLEQDYQTAMSEEAKKLGVDLETLRIAKQREGEDQDRRLAELQTDYELTNGRISEDKAKQLGRLLVERDNTLGQLSTEQQNLLTDIKKQYGEALDAKTNEMAGRGLTYSGMRTKAENKIKTDQTTAETRTNDAYGQKIADVNRQYGYSTQDIVDAARRQVEDATTAYNRSKTGITTSYQRNLADLNRQEQLRREQSQSTTDQLGVNRDRSLADIATNRAITERNTNQYIASQNLNQSRGVEDIIAALEKQRKQNELDKQTQIETGYYGVNQQYDRAYNNYLSDQASYEANRLTPSAILKQLSSSLY